MEQLYCFIVRYLRRFTPARVFLNSFLKPVTKRPICAEMTSNTDQTNLLQGLTLTSRQNKTYIIVKYEVFTTAELIHWLAASLTMALQAV